MILKSILQKNFSIELMKLEREFSYEGDDEESEADEPQRKLKDNWFSLVPNPDDPEDKGPCIQILEAFHHVIVRYKNFQLHKKLNEDGSINCDFEYDILMDQVPLVKII